MPTSRLPHKISTLLYGFDRADRVLLMQRAQEPNRGLWSPCGGKLNTELGESPYACACREAEEELGIPLKAADIRLTGLISESGYQGTSHWLMFLFEIVPKLCSTPPPHREGRFDFFRREDLTGIPLPETDRTFIWPAFWDHRGGFFSACCACLPNGTLAWHLEESRPRFSA